MLAVYPLRTARVAMKHTDTEMIESPSRLVRRQCFDYQSVIIQQCRDHGLSDREVSAGPEGYPARPGVVSRVLPTTHDLAGHGRACINYCGTPAGGHLDNGL